VIGGVIGNQFGSGRGNDAATVVGAVGGGYVGNEIEKDAKEKTAGYNVIRVPTAGALQVGDRVRVTGGGNIHPI
jgi:uncharacterized protein YcfJ